MGSVKASGPSGPSGNKTSNGPVHFRPTPMSGPVKQTTSFKEGDSRNPNSHNRVRPPLRRLTPAEIAYRRENDLCYRCDEKYHRRHLCPKGELRLLVVQSDGVELEMEEEEETTTKGEGLEVAEMTELSLNSLVGISSPRTMKLRGRVKESEVVVMIDSGATHNFIFDQLVRRLGMTPMKTNGYEILTGNGVTVQGEGICKGVTLRLQEHTIRADFLPLELGSADVILGV